MGIAILCSSTTPVSSSFSQVLTVGRKAFRVHHQLRMAGEESWVVTCTAPVNIAVIKYWGKRDERLILPINDSVSVTLSSAQMNAKTSVTASPNFSKDRIWLNGKEESAETGRLASCLSSVRDAAHKQRGKAGEASWRVAPPLKVHICSENNFPTAAGLASSAA